MLDFYSDCIRRNHNPLPLGVLLGFQLTAASPGHATIEASIAAQHDNSMGRTHGGVICAIADSAMGIAHACALVDGRVSLSVELKVSFVAPARLGRLCAEARVIRQGRRIAFLECAVINELGELVAKATGTYISAKAGASGAVSEQSSPA